MTGGGTASETKLTKNFYQTTDTAYCHRLKSNFALLDVRVEIYLHHAVTQQE